MQETKTQYETVIGLEIHIQLATKTKMFCRCDNDSDGVAPNTNVCPICMGYPGTLPVANEQAILWGNKAALALGCTLNSTQRFDRKNYFYPDLPKGYQISQFFFPAGEHGHIDVDYLGPDRKTKMSFGVGITRLHLEEDAGKLIHEGDYSYADYNRCGTPLMEIVTEPDIKSPEEARAFIQELQRIVRALGVSQADMEKGHLRVDGNISIRPVGQKEFGSKVEVKNINSAKYLEQALKFEEKRQAEILDKGEVVVQETRGWDEKTNSTISQRIKEGSIDYRYFPDPDLPPVVLSDDTIVEIAKQTTKLPSGLRKEVEDLGLSYARLSELQDRGELAKLVETVSADKSLDINVAANWVDKEFASSELFAEFLKAVKDHNLSNTMAGKVYADISAGKDIASAVANLPQADSGAARELVAKVLADNADVVARYKAGETKLIGFLAGQVMKEGRGQIEPAEVQRLLAELLPS